MNSAPSRPPRRPVRLPVYAVVINMRPLWLDPIPTVLHGQALAALDERNVVGFLNLASNEDGLDLVAMNRELLMAYSMYEAALLDAFISTRTNNVRWPPRHLKRLFDLAQRERLRAAGDRLPDAGPFVLYRGVAGVGADRRVRCLSWTNSIEQARWFADRYEMLPGRAVYQVTVGADAVLAYLDEAGRAESEFIVMLPPGARPRCIERRG